MNKAMLLMMLMRQAPRLLDALTQNGQFDQLGGDGLDAGGGITSALNRGYDPNLIQEAVDDTYPLGIHNELDAANMDYTNYLNKSDNVIDIFKTPKGSAINPEIVYPYSLNKIYQEAVDTMPARASAAAMLENNPNIGLETPVPDVDTDSTIGSLEDELENDIHSSEMPYHERLRLQRIYDDIKKKK